LNERLNLDARALQTDLENRITFLKDREPDNKFGIKEAERLRDSQMRKERAMIAKLI
jgi:hypothetical protein